MWEGTNVVLPSDWTGRAFTNVLDDTTTTAASDRLPADQVLASLPVAILKREG
jgi:maltooligosyltrehalose synthase